MPDAALVSTTLDTDYLCLAVSPMHRLARAKTVSVEEIRHEKLIDVYKRQSDNSVKGRGKIQCQERKL